MSTEDSTLASESSESHASTTLVQLPPSFVNTLVSTGNLGDKKSIAQDVRRAVREKTFPLAKFVQLGDPMVMGFVGGLIRKELEYSEDDWKGVWGNIMKQVVAETNRKRNSVSTDLKKHLFKVVREEDEDCPLSWENDEGLQQLVEQKRKAPDAWTWFVDNCLKQVNVTVYNNFVKTGIMKPSEAFTKSDEGLAITLLINGYPRWRVQVNQNDRDTDQPALPATLYTCPGVKNEPWKPAGLQKFNEFCMAVDEDRKSPAGQKFEEEYQQKALEAYAGKKLRKRKACPTATVTVYLDVEVESTSSSVASVESGQHATASSAATPSQRGRPASRGGSRSISGTRQRGAGRARRVGHAIGGAVDSLVAAASDITPM